MTEMHTDPPTPPSAPTSGARETTPALRRRATDRVLGGVASGLADYLNVDPLLIRVGLVGLVLFNGAGFFIYLAAWLFIPLEGSNGSIVEGWLRRPRGDVATAAVAVVVLIVIVGTVLNSLVDRVDTRMGWGVGPWFGLALIVIAAGVLLFRRPAADSAGMTAQTFEGDLSHAGVTAPPATSWRANRAPRDRSPLGLYVLGVLLLTLGAVAAIDVASTDDVLPRTYAGLALVILGIGLAVGARWGRARWLIVVGVLVVPAALALSFVRAPLNGYWGTEWITPASSGELLDRYDVAGGRLTLDLSNLPPLTGERRISAEIGIGRLQVILPEGARAEVNAAVGGGTLELFGAQQEGTSLTDRRVIEGTGQPLIVDIEAGLGAVIVQSAGPQE